MASRMKSVKAKFDRHPDYKVPRRIYDIQTKAESGPSRKIAEKFLKKIAKEIGISSDLSELTYDKTERNLLGTQVLFQQQIGGKPVSGGWIKVSIDNDSKVFAVLNELVPKSVVAKSAKEVGKAAPIPESLARANALKATGCHLKKREAEVLETEDVAFAEGGPPVPAWKVVLRARRPAAEWKVYVDARDGKILKKVSLLRRMTGLGRVFDPNPVVALNDTSLTDRSSIPDAAYREVELLGLSNDGRLDGTFVSTRRTSSRVKRSSRKFRLKRGQKGFTEVMIYYHIDRAQRYLQDLGFDNINNRQIEVDAAGTTDDQSWYSPTSRTLTFGTGGVDDAEDADIILHEYGHSMQDDQVPGFGESHECGSMGEGFGDYFAGSFFADYKSETLRACVGSWDATSYSGAEPPCLRRLDSNKRYPKDLTNEVHDDGEIWSACLWELRRALGRLAADRMILAHHFLLSRTATFEDGAMALLTTDEQLTGGVHRDAIREVFVRRGILANPKRKNRRAGARLKFAK